MTFLWGWNPTQYTNSLFSKCVLFTACVCVSIFVLSCLNLIGGLHGRRWCLLVLAVPCRPLFRMRCHAPLIPITLHWAGLTTPAVGTCMPAKGPWSLGPGTDSPAHLWASVWVPILKLQCRPELPASYISLRRPHVCFLLSSMLRSDQWPSEVFHLSSHRQMKTLLHEH